MTNSSLNDLYKTLRNRFRYFSIADSFQFIWAIWNNVQNDKPIPAGIEMLPQFNPRGSSHDRKMASIFEWELEFLLTETILNSNTVPSNDHSLKKLKHLKPIMKELRAFSNVVDKLVLDGTHEKTFHELNRIAHRQFPWQVPPDSYTIFRYFKIYNDDTISAFFKAEFNTTPLDYFVTALSVASVYNKYPASMLKKINIERVTDEMWENFVNRYSTTYQNALAEIKGKREMNEKFFFGFSYHRLKPLILFEGFYYCPIGTLLLWQITDGVYYYLKEHKGFFDNIGKAFENYVGYILGRMPNPNNVIIYPEELYGKPQKNTSDWILEDQTGILFLECKAKRMTLHTKIETILTEYVDYDLTSIAKAVFQGYKTYVDYKNNLYPTLKYKEGKKVHIQVITLEEWFLDINIYFLDLIHSKIIDLFKKHSLAETLLDEVNYKITSIDHFEGQGQIIFQMGIVDYYSSISDGSYFEKVKKYSTQNIIWDDFKKELYDKTFKPG